MAMDESRALFPLTRLADDTGAGPASLVEMWFRGVHSDVGGGNRNKGMNWIALHWMYRHALRCGLPIDPAAVAANLVNKALPQAIGSHKLDLEVERRFLTNDSLHVSVQLIASGAGRLNNPAVALRRLDDDGNVVTA
jgi:hypothetical protein